MLPFHTILCPLDFSESSYKALHSAAELATQFGAQLLLVHVLAPIPVLPPEPAYLFPPIPVVPIESAGAIPPSTTDQPQQELAAEERLKITVRDLPSELRTLTLIGTGDAADEIVRIASTKTVDLIVIAT